MNIARILTKSRKVIYILFVVTLLGALGHENDFTWVGFVWALAALVFGLLGVAAMAVAQED